MTQETNENVQSQSVSSIVLSVERLRHVLDYNKETGIFTWKNPSGRRVKSGQIAGCDNGSGYIVIRIDGTNYRAHRLAWYYIYGEWSLVDHKDGRRGNNSISNLRKCTLMQNTGNQEVRYTNLLGIKGVQERHGKYRAYITVNYKVIHLGTFIKLEDAIKARQEAAKKHFGEFSNG